MSLLVQSSIELLYAINHFSFFFHFNCCCSHQYGLMLPGFLVLQPIKFVDAHDTCGRDLL